MKILDKVKTLCYNNNRKGDAFKRWESVYLRRGTAFGWVFKWRKLTVKADFKSGEKNMAKQHKEQPFNIYGIRETRNEKYMALTLVRGEESKEWLNVPVNVNNVKVKDGYGYVKIKLLDKVKKEADKSKKSDEEIPF